MRPSLVFGVVSEKDRREMVEALFPLARTVHLAPPATERAVPPSVLVGEAAGLAELRQHPNVRAALEAALAEEGESGAVLVCGSLFVVGEALSNF